MISGMSRATILVSDLDVAREFYTNTLGFKENAHAPSDLSYDRTRSSKTAKFIRPRPSPCVEVSPVGADILIYLKESRERYIEWKKPQWALMPRYQQFGKAVLALRTDDLMAEWRRLNESGVPFVIHPQFCGPDDDRFDPSEQRLICAAFTDPDNNVIVLEQELEAGDPGPIGLEYWAGE